MPRVKSLKLTEAQFTTQVIQYAKLRGWKVAHFRAARTKDGWRTPCQGDAKGFPDLVLVRERVLWIELKLDGKGATPEQQAWLAALDSIGEWAMIWRPEDWERIERVLA